MAKGCLTGLPNYKNHLLVLIVNKSQLVQKVGLSLQGFNRKKVMRTFVVIAQIFMCTGSTSCAMGIKSPLVAGVKIVTAMFFRSRILEHTKKHISQISF